MILRWLCSSAQQEIIISDNWLHCGCQWHTVTLAINVQLWCRKDETVLAGRRMTNYSSFRTTWNLNGTETVHMTRTLASAPWPECITCHQQGHAGSKTSLQQNPPVIHSGCQIKQADLYTDQKQSMVQLLFRKTLKLERTSCSVHNIYCKHTLGSYLLNWSSPRPKHSKHKIPLRTVTMSL